MQGFKNWLKRVRFNGLRDTILCVDRNITQDMVFFMLTYQEEFDTIGLQLLTIYVKEDFGL